MQEVHFCMVG